MTSSVTPWFSSAVCSGIAWLSSSSAHSLRVVGSLHKRLTSAASNAESAAGWPHALCSALCDGMALASALPGPLHPHVQTTATRLFGPEPSARAMPSTLLPPPSAPSSSHVRRVARRL